MRIYGSFAHRETDAPLSRRGAMTGWRKYLAAVTLLAGATGIVLAQQQNNEDAFLPNPTSPVRTVSTVPRNGDVNPYGVAFVGDNFQTGSGPLKPGDVLVSNFNNSQNLQGTGTTIVRISKGESPKVFFQGTAPLGLLRRWERCRLASWSSAMPPRRTAPQPQQGPDRCWSSTIRAS